MPEKILSPHYDAVIIGAGLYGIQAARYYLELHPKAQLAIIESDEVIGGVWSSKRIYDAFWTQTPVGMAEFSDRPLSPPPPPEDQYYGFFPAKYVTSYLETYIDDHIYNGVSIRERIMFNTWVTNVEKTPDKLWTLSCENKNGNSIVKTAKLIDASGLTSRPNVPAILGKESFSGLAIHHKDFGQHQSTILSAYGPQHIVIVGGGKSAADVAYACAKAPGSKKISWVIREDGNGPAAFLSAEGKGGYRNSNEAFYTRLMAAFLPNVFGGRGWVGRLLHGTRIGRWVVKKVWDQIDRDYRTKANFKREDGRDNGFGELEPETPIFWQNDSSGINSRPDLYSAIASQVHIYRQNIDRVSERSVTLACKSASDDKPITLPLDVLVYCTGWSPSTPFFNDEMALRLGLLSPSNKIDPRIGSRWESLEAAADLNVVAQFPTLKHPPPYHHSAPKYTPFRLYKAMVPLDDAENHSIVFLGKMVVGNNFRVAEVQALWAVAYLDGHITCSHGKMEEDVALTVAWCRRRYLNRGELGSYFFFDVIDYTDGLLAQLDLSYHRRKGWKPNLFSTCTALDFRGLLEEYKTLHSV